ncbi:MAG: sensor histidine kinase [Alkalispirochaeta sp.]
MVTSRLKSRFSEQSFAVAVYRIASSFVSLDDPDTIINEALRVLGRVCDAGRSYVFLFDYEKETMDNTHEWCAEGVTPEIDMLTDLPLSMFPWWMERLRNGELILVPDVSAMPPEATAEREILEEQDILSVLVLPIYTERELAGFIGLDNVQYARTWDDDTREYLQVAADMVSSTLTRERRFRVAAERTRELEEANRTLREAKMNLLHAEKMAGIGTLAAGVAHEINNPIGFLRSNTETLIRYIRDLSVVIGSRRAEGTEGTDPTSTAPGAPASVFAAGAGSGEAPVTDTPFVTPSVTDDDIAFILADTQDILESTLHGLDRIANIVGSLTELSRKSSEEKTVYRNLNEEIDRALTLADTSESEKIEIAFVPGRIPPVRCNTSELFQVILNIVSNTKDAIRSSSRAGQGRLEVHTRHRNKFVECVFSDNGPGIPDHVLQRVFEPFYTTKGVGEGTGLGLSLAYDLIVNKHGGEIEAGNSEGGGARITVRLPVEDHRG